MRRGAYSAELVVAGQGGTPGAIVPVLSVATGRLGLSNGLALVLLVLGALLLAGLITIVRAAAGESVTPVGESMTPAQRRRANLAGAISAPLLAAAVWGRGAWWRAGDL